MKAFISWSGSLSHHVAVALREWLPAVLQAVEPYVSSEDIDKGARWSTDISRELEESTFGILCVTPDNLDAPWLHFEAGALSKSFDKGRVSPFLFGLQRSEIPPGPLLQFQSTLFEREEVFKLVQSINASCGDTALDEGRLLRALEVWWPRLVEALEPFEAQSQKPVKKQGAPRGSSDVLAEILDLARSHQRILSSPDELLPRDYLEEIVGRSRPPVSRAAIRDLEERFAELRGYVSFPPHQGDPDAEMLALLDSLERPIRYILRRMDGSFTPHRLRFSDRSSIASEEDAES